MSKRPLNNLNTAKARLQRRAKSLASSVGQLHVTRPSLPKLSLLYFARHATPEQLDAVIECMENQLGPKLQRVYMSEVEQDLFVT